MFPSGTFSLPPRQTAELQLAEEVTTTRASTVNYRIFGNRSHDFSHSAVIYGTGSSDGLARVVAASSSNTSRVVSPELRA
jgi:hypothetical protein